MERLTARNENGKKEAYYPYCFREDTFDGDGSSEKCDTCEFSTKICEKLAEYEDTVLTPQEIMEMKERDTAKEPIKDTGSRVRYTDDYICPNCGRHFTGTGIAEFCYHCGQRIRWED